MPKYHLLLSIILSTIFTLSQAGTIVFKNNEDLNLTLSQSNYNRLVVKNDKIIKAFFPPATMAVANDEDGSLYVTLAANAVTPFTLFITTEKDRHFSATVSSEITLGKTIEFVEFQPKPLLALKTAKKLTASPPKQNFQPTALLLKQMLAKQKPQGFASQKHFGKAIRLNQGIVLLPKETFSKDKLAGEILEVYNNSSKPVILKESWFASKDVKTVALPQALVLPKQKVLLYRVLEKANA